MDYVYGPGPDQIDPFFQAKRSWSSVKDKILGHYIDCYLKTVQHLQRRIVLVDGFAGPGVFGDGAPGSPLIICKSISDNAKGKVGIGCLFADIRTAHREALARNIATFIKASVSEPPFSDWSEAVGRALEIGAGARKGQHRSSHQLQFPRLHAHERELGVHGFGRCCRAQGKGR